MPSSKYPDSRHTFKRKVGLLLTDKQLEQIAAKHHLTNKELKVDALGDSLPRDIFIDLLVLEVMGEKYHWPLNQDGSEYSTDFFETFPIEAEKKGFKLFKKYWGIN